VAIVIDNDSKNNSLQNLMNWIDTDFKNDNDQPIKYKFFERNELDDQMDFNSLGKVIFIQNNHNDGFAKGNNLVLRHLLKHDGYIWLLNPDMVVKENTLSELVGFADKQPSDSITGCVTRSYLEQDKILFYGGAKINFNSATISVIRSKKEAGRMDYICGGSLFSHTKHFKDIGLLPEDYFLFWEEADWCYKAGMKGYNMLVCPTAVCYDKISTSIGRGFLADFYYTRNGLLFLKKYKRQKITMALLFVILRFSARIVTGKWTKAKGVLKGTLAFLKINKYDSK
jgi:Predicted glycosyltransferases